VQLQAAVLALVLAHGPASATGLSSVLERLLVPAGFQQLPPPLQAGLLASGEQLLLCMPTSRHQSTVQAVSQLALQPSSPGAAAGAGMPSWLLLAAAWRGLATLAGTAAASSKVGTLLHVACSADNTPPRPAGRCRG
jgi:hypothetical protein